MRRAPNLLTRYSSTRAGACPKRTEAAFSLLEMIVVMVVIAILMAIVISQFRGAKSSVRSNEAKTVGAAYAQAISQFQADHANRNPVGTDNVNVGGQPAGPVNLLGKPYIGTLPDAVGVRVGVDMSGSCSGPGGGMALGWVMYCPEGAGPNFGVRVNTRTTLSDPWNGGCWLGSTARTPRC